MCLMESAMAGGFGFQIETTETFRKDCFLFGESQGRVVVTVSADQDDAFRQLLFGQHVSFTKLGEVFGKEAVIDKENFGSIAAWRETHLTVLGDMMDQHA
jgi:phosphoribosylformylglycinamidine synthase